MRSSPADPDPLSAGFGALRDALGAIGNLQQLLGSRNVSPKAITQLLPDMLDACQPLEQQLKAFFHEVAQGSADNASTELEGFVLAQVGALSKAITQVRRSKRVISASGRLSLERAVKGVERNLAGALPLLEIIADNTKRPFPALDVVELLTLSRSGDQPQTPKSKQVRAHLSSSHPSVTLHSTPRSAMMLFGLAGSCVPLSQDQSHLLLELGVDAGSAKVACRPTEPADGGFLMSLPPKTEVTAESLRSVALGMGIELSLDPNGVTLRWPC